MDQVSASANPTVNPGVAAALLPNDRLVSLDALRGFDMFWINGGEGIVHALAAWLGWGWLTYLSKVQLEHVDWDGFRFYDLIFPMFLFLSGVTMPLTLTRRLERGESKSTLYWRVARRVVLLILLGWVYNGILRLRWGGRENPYFNFEQFRFATVLGLIGISYFFAALVVINTRIRGQIIWAAGILIGYWVAAKLIAVPHFETGEVKAGDITAPGFFTGFIDRHLLPGRQYLKTHDPEGLFLPIAGTAMALLGALAGHWLMSLKWNKAQKGAGLLVGGLCALLVGMLIANPTHPIAQFWHAEEVEVPNRFGFPIIKNVWSSSFIVYAAGWAAILLAVFYFIIDVIGWRAWALPFVVIGVNAILLYVGAGIIDFNGIAGSLFGGITGYFDTLSKGLGRVLMSLAIVLVEVLFLYFLYRKKVFLRV